MKNCQHEKVSGVIGRYLYAGVHHGLYGSKSELQELAVELQKSAPGATVSALLGPIREELVAFDRMVLAPPETLGGSVALMVPTASAAPAAAPTAAAAHAFGK